MTGVAKTTIRVSFVSLHIQKKVREDKEQMAELSSSSIALPPDHQTTILARSFAFPFLFFRKSGAVALMLRVAARAHYLN